ncbi:MAG TPA: hypothetical protein DCL60_02560 [Armatimonadetes bacterium]|jgi:nickel-dependent lactate racemase|nr:hypothetical protein [Armatimonadota bacterium]
MDDLEIRNEIASGLAGLDLSGKRIIMLIPDTTRTAPVAEMCRIVHDMLRESGAKLDFLVALGTHHPMSREDLLHHVGATAEAYNVMYAGSSIFNHNWSDTTELAEIGEISASSISMLTGGILNEGTRIAINRHILDYDHILILGPVFPHEVIGFSGGNKYIFPGICGPEFIDFFHWLAGLIGSMDLIGVLDNPVRRLVEQAADLVPVPTTALSMVVLEDGTLDGLYVGPTRESWKKAANHSARVHIIYKPRLFKRVLACVAPMYHDLKLAIKAICKCEPVVEDGGELIIYGPQVTSLSHARPEVLQRVGCHVRDYFLCNMERFADVPRGVLATACYLKGKGTYEGGREKTRIQIKFATGVTRELCNEVNLEYVDPTSININDWRNHENEGILLVENAGEIAYRY